MSGHSTGVRKNESLLGSEGNASGSAVGSDFESDSDQINFEPKILRRNSSLFSFESKENLPKPEPQEYTAFIEDDRHFSLIRNLHMADFITLLNGFSGFYSIISSLRYCSTGRVQYIQRSLFFIVLGLFFDFFDGRVARLRNKSSLMGQELDSLADLISFGVSPGAIAFSIGFDTTVDVLFLTFWVLCGLTRLARFNISTNNIPKDKHGKAQYFEGLPIPSNLIWVGIMSYMVWKDYIHEHIPYGVLFKDTIIEFHPIAILFALHGCAEISKSLKIPKP